MARHDFAAPRLYVSQPLGQDREIELTRDQANYLVNVLRLADGATILAFDGHSGEWRARILGRGRKIVLRAEHQTRPQEGGPDLDYLFAPLKHARLDYMVGKATEMGAARLRPVLTRRTQVARVNLDRMRANVIEAAEQCGILAVPVVEPPEPIERALRAWPPDRLLVFCDEEAPVHDPVAALGGWRDRLGERPSLALLVGPEGGFEAEERAAILALPRVARLSLGPRVLRADTAAVAGLAILGAVLSDRHPP
jgi:16S rRNA (uracil1498-N3)-methyltransferase